MVSKNELTKIFHPPIVRSQEMNP